MFHKMIGQTCLLLVIHLSLTLTGIETAHLNTGNGGTRNNATRAHRRVKTRQSLPSFNIKVQGRPTYQRNGAPVGFRASMSITPGLQSNRQNITRRIIPNIVRRRQGITNILNPRLSSPLISVSSSNKNVRVIPLNPSRNATVSLPIRLPKHRGSIQRQLPTRRRVVQQHGGTPISAMSVLRRLIPKLNRPRRLRRIQSTLPRGRINLQRIRNMISRPPPFNRVDNIIGPIPNPRKSAMHTTIRQQNKRANLNSKSNNKIRPVTAPKQISQRLQKLPKLRKESPDKSIKSRKQAKTETKFKSKKSNADLKIAVTTPKPVVDAYNGTDMVIELNKTLNKYGLDIDGLINLLQSSQTQIKQPPPVNTELPPAWPVVHAVPDATSHVHHSAHNRMPINTTPKDTPFRALSDVRNELRDIALFLETGNIERSNQTEIESISSPSLESTGNPVMDEMIQQMLLETMKRRIPQ